MGQQLTVEQAIRQAELAIEDNNVVDAVQLYQLVLTHFPDNAAATRGMQYLQSSPSSSGDFPPLPPDQVSAVFKQIQSNRFSLAELTINCLLRLYPHAHDLYNLLGAAQQGQGKLEESIQTFTRAIEINPGYAPSYYNRGTLYKTKGHLKQAVADFNMTLALKPNFADAHSNKGIALSEMGRHDNALQSYNQAISIKSDSAVFYFNRAITLADLERWEEAIDDYEKSIALQNDFAKAHRHLSLLKTYQPGDPQIKMVNKLLNTQGIKNSDRIQYHFALSKAYDDIQDYHKGFYHVTQGNKLRREKIAYQFERDLVLAQKARSYFTADIFCPLPPGEKNKGPNLLFIVGMPRSGSTLVEQILATHTAVHGMGETDEITRLVGPVLADLPSEEVHMDDAIEQIQKGFLATLPSEEVSKQCLVDKSLLNFMWAGLILSAFPSAKIINVTRNPVATCWSIYKHYFTGTGHGYALDMDDIVKFYGLYIDQMKFWQNCFPGAIYHLDYDRLTEYQIEESKALLSFCELDWQDRCINFHRTQRVVKTASAIQVKKKLYKGSSSAWKNYKFHLTPMIAKLKKAGIIAH